MRLAASLMIMDRINPQQLSSLESQTLRLYSFIVFNIDTDGLQIGLWELEGDLFAGKFLVDSRESIGL